MPEAVQIILLITLTSITIVLVIIGVQVFLLIKEVRMVIKNAGTAVEKLHASAQGLLAPLSNISGILKEISVTGVFKLIKTLLSNKK